MKPLLPLLCALFVAQLSTSAQTVVTFDSAKVTAGDAQPGSNVVVTVSFKIQEGYYLHSNRPSVPRAVPTFVQVGTIPAARTLPTSYGGTGQKTVPGIPQPVAVYENVMNVQVPVVISPNAGFPISLAGMASYAPVDAKSHVVSRPEQVRFTVNIPRATNAPPAAAKAPANTKAPVDPKKK